MKWYNFCIALYMGDVDGAVGLAMMDASPNIQNAIF